jgi:hypothetical protein
VPVLVPSYKSYVDFCVERNITPVPYADFGFTFWLELCKEHRIANAVNNEDGESWFDVLKIPRENK